MPRCRRSLLWLLVCASSESLRAAGAAVELVTYEGGHGWRGDVYGNIRRGLRWLEDHAAP